MSWSLPRRRVRVAPTDPAEDIARARSLAARIAGRANRSRLVDDFIDVTARLPFEDVARVSSLIQRAIKPTFSLYEFEGEVVAARVREARRLAVPHVDLFHPDGYRREWAMRRHQGASPNAFLFAALLLRINDWVPQVRAAARETIPSIAAVTDPRLIAEAVPALLVDRGFWTNIEDAIDVASESLLVIPAVAECFAEILKTSPVGPMSKVLRQASRAPTMDLHLVDIAGSAVQPAVRARAYRMLFEGKARWRTARGWRWTDKAFSRQVPSSAFAERALTIAVNRRALMAAAAADGSTAARKAAAAALVADLQAFGQTGEATARRLASDPEPSVAGLAQFALRTRSAEPV